MAKEIDFPTTQRAYTLRLRRAPGQCSHCNKDDCHCWRDALWATHEAVNKGAKVFGEWLLTLRGGLDHELADQPVKERGNTTRPPTDAERRDRRILLALSWLSVEDAQGAPDDESLIVVRGIESTDCRARKLADALTVILQARGVVASESGDPNLRPEDQPGTWLGDCMASFSAAIREDAVWVNRSQAFDHVAGNWDIRKARLDAETLLKHVLSDDFLILPTAKKGKAKENEASDDEALEERRSAVKASSRGAGNRTRHPFSHLFGEGRPFGKPARTLDLRDDWQRYLKPKLDKSGIPVIVSANTKKESKKTGPAHTELHREMFSKAASRVAQIVTKQRQQEADRIARTQADTELRDMENDPSFTDSLKALHAYCDEYRVSSGASGEYQIQLRQITKWDQVLKRWESIVETDPDVAREARIQAVKDVQESNEGENFGDANLFFRLADEPFAPAWRLNGTIDAKILDRFVRGMKARGDAERLKVAAYRHPDPYRNPVFCQFGVSRPTIRFRRLKAFTHKPEENDPRAIGMLLWHPATRCAQLTLLHGVSQRLDREIGASCDQVQQNADAIGTVSRRGRLGMAAGGLPTSDSPARVAGVFDLKRIARRTADEETDGIDGGDTEFEKLKEPRWNGTLSTDRDELRAIRNLIGDGKAQKAEHRRKRLHWTLTVSMEMEGRGPWYRYIADLPEATPFLRTVRKDKPRVKNNPNAGFAERKGDKRLEVDGWPWQEFNKPLKDNRDGSVLVDDTAAARASSACLILSRLPGLRVLALDLGHRYAAACAVWEAVSLNLMRKACQDAGAPTPDPLAMFVHLKSTNSRGKPTTTIYRRIGSDSLPDGTPHPAPWARLDRQFLIKLQGEDRPPRAASPDEFKAVEDFERWAGLRRQQIATPRKRAVDLLMSDAVRTARLALARHGRRARIAFQMTAECRMLPGGRHQILDETGRKELLTDALVDWHTLATDSRWVDDPARQLWNQHLAGLDDGFQIAPPGDGSQTEPEPNRAQRCQAEQELRQRLAPLVEVLASNPDLRQQLHHVWADRWNADDQQWLLKLRWLSRWLMPRGGSRRDASRRHVGGLSLTRISTLTDFRRKVQVGFFTRLRPDGTKAEIGRSFGQSTLDAIQRLKDQRIKQLASRIVEAALGIGYERHAANGSDLPRPRASSPDPRFAPCHAVVIEDLSHYRPEETRTRRENRATMDWKSAETRKRLADHCQLYGLHLRDVNPQYTSRQDSRTGAPGMRCVDVSITDFLTKPRWRKQVAQAQKKDRENKGDARDRYLLELEGRWANATEAERASAGLLRIPMNGGELFVSADRDSPLVAGIQADLNAAANIGLRALMDPDFPGKWWYVPCDRGTKQPHAEKVKGSILQSVGPLAQADRTDQGGEAGSSRRRSGRGAKEKEIVNLWRDPRAEEVRGAEGSESWSETPAYWNAVKVRVMNILRLRMKREED